VSATGVSRETPPLTAEDVQRLTGADAMTIARLAEYRALLRHWQRRINLVGAASLADAWRRHILDSLQLRKHLPARPRSPSIVDVGSGAGFPGMVLAISGEPQVTLIEADARKCAFLREVARACDVPVGLRHGRAEHLRELQADVVTARAVAPLPRLLPLAAPLLRSEGRCLLLKGRSVGRELTEAGKVWKMTTTMTPSESDPDGVVLIIDGLRQRHA
jgi:16S rRNA (guanine527-N7)-methyltransferase